MLVRCKKCIFGGKNNLIKNVIKMKYSKYQSQIEDNLLSYCESNPLFDEKENDKDCDKRKCWESCKLK